MNSETKITLARKALKLCGVTLDGNITDLDAREPNAVACREEWDKARDELLRMKEWNFAKTRVNLTRTDDPLFGYRYAWLLPADYIRALEFNCVPAGTGMSRYDIEGPLLLSCPVNSYAVVNLLAPTSEPAAQLRYIFREETVSKWDANFCNAFVYLLASAIAPGLSSAANMGLQLRQFAQQMVAQAFGPNNNEGRPRVITGLGMNSGYMRARWAGTGGGYPYNVPAGWWADAHGVWQANDCCC
jgi:hypothetical protein